MPPRRGAFRGPGAPGGPRRGPVNGLIIRRWPRRPVSKSRAGSRVAEIVDALSALEADIDSLDVKLAEMGKGLAAKAREEIEAAAGGAREAAAKEAEAAVAKARAEAEAEAGRITADGEARLEKMRARIDAEMDGAVAHVVATILRP